MSPATLMRNRYVSDSVATASPSKLLCMLYDKLVLDLVQAEDALATADFDRANSRLQNAQEIVIELRASLKLDSWDGAAGLARLYSYLLTELVGANVTRSVPRVVAARGLVEPLRDAWYEAAAAS